MQQPNATDSSTFHIVSSSLRSPYPYISQINRESAGQSGAYTGLLSLLSLNVCGLPDFAAAPSSLPGDLTRFLALGEAVAQASRDIILLQEVWTKHAASILAPIAHKYRASGSRTSALKFGSGLLTLSRFPIIEDAFYKFRTRIGLERVVEKGVLFTRIAHPFFGKVDIYNTHLISEPERLNRWLVGAREAVACRGEQLIELRRFVDQHSVDADMVVVGGDFNIPDHHRQYLDLARLFGEDVVAQYGRSLARLQGGVHPLVGEQRYTFDPARNPWARNLSKRSERLDYIFLFKSPGHGLHLLASHELTERPLSDHYAVAATFFASPGNSYVTQEVVENHFFQ